MMKILHHLQPKKFSNALTLGGLLLIFVAVPLTVILIQRAEETRRVGALAANYTIDELIADMRGNTEGVFCPGYEGWDFPNRGDGLPSNFETIRGSQVTGWGTAQWRNCGVQVSGVRWQIQNYKMYGWTGSNWVTYGGQPGDWCSLALIDTGTLTGSCSNSGTTSSPNFEMPNAQRSVHWATTRLSVISGTRCFANYYESKYSGGAALMVNVGADDIDPSAGIQPRHYVSKYKAINNIDWTPVGGSNCPESVLRANPPPFVGGTGGADTTDPTVSLTAPANNATVSGSSVTISANASDNVGVTQVQFFVDGQSVNSDTSSPYSYAWNSTTKANGTYQVFARARDAAGNEADSTSRTITVNNTTNPPPPPPPPPTGYTVDDLVADMNGTTQGSLCSPVNSYDFGQRGDGLPSNFETIDGTQVTGWGTAQWRTCGSNVSGVRLQIQNYKMYGWTGSNWVTYGGQPGDWCVTSNVDTGTGFSSDCNNTGTTSSPNFAMPNSQRAIHWATSRVSVISGTRCFVNYYEAKSSGSAPILVNAGADDIDPSAGIQPRHYVSRYKLINTTDWTPIGGSNCPETVLRSSPPPGMGGTSGDTTPPTISNGSPSGVLAAGTTSTTMSVTTNEAATCKYGTTAGVAFTSIANTFSTTGGTNHSVSITGLTNGASRTYYIRCRDVANNANSSDYTISFSVATGSTTLPTPWQTADIGSVGVVGSASHSFGTFTVAGSGDDIWNTADAFRFVYQDLTGDGTITARVVSQTNTDPWAKAGVMIRENLTAGSKNALAMVTPSNGTNFQYRSSADADAIHVGGSGGPMWVRVQRSGNTITGFRSNDGSTWTTTGSSTISMGTTVKVGLAVTSHNNSVLSQVSFSNVSVTVSGGCTKVADINCDNSVNSTDLAALLNKWGTTDMAADLNNSGRVDSADLAIMIANWGR